jgi:hypothetical protein
MKYTRDAVIKDKLNNDIEMSRFPAVHEIFKGLALNILRRHKITSFLREPLLFLLGVGLRNLDGSLCGL